MSYNELRSELLAQHDELRQLTAILKQAAERAPDEPRRLEDVRQLLATLGAEVRAHNAFEEAVLHPFLPSVDAWGPVRDRRVDEHHAAEHLAIANAIVAAHEQRDPAGLVAQTLAVIAELVRHLAEEERELLASDVLRDDIITSGVDG